MSSKGQMHSALNDGVAGEAGICESRVGGDDGIDAFGYGPDRSSFCFLIDSACLFGGPRLLLGL